MKQVLEPAGSAALAATLAGRIPIRDGERVAVVLSGGNVEVSGSASSSSGPVRCRRDRPSTRLPLPPATDGRPCGEGPGPVVAAAADAETATGEPAGSAATGEPPSPAATQPGATDAGPLRSSPRL